MDAQFWINAWTEGRTQFHKTEYHEKLLEYFPGLNSKTGQLVLVPLCGKSKDLLWLHSQGLEVHGIELYEKAVQSFFVENDLRNVDKVQDQSFTHYNYKNMQISCGDFFKLDKNESYDFVYDRASLVALPASMRKGYAEVMKRSLKIGGKYLLIVYEYDQSQLSGPPFSISDREVHELFEDRFSIKLLERQETFKEGPRLSSLESLIQAVYSLEKQH